MIRKLVYILNVVLFTMCGYLYGHYTGINTPSVDQNSIERAVAQAMLEQ